MFLKLFSFESSDDEREATRFVYKREGKIIEIGETTRGLLKVFYKELLACVGKMPRPFHPSSHIPVGAKKEISKQSYFQVRLDENTAPQSLKIYGEEDARAVLCIVCEQGAFPLAMKTNGKMEYSYMRVMKEFSSDEPASGTFDLESMYFISE